MKVLHLPSNVAGNAFGLAQGERQLGLDAKALSIGKSVYDFPSDLIIPAKNTLLSQLYHRAQVFLKARAAYDVFHFNFGSSLIHYLDLGLNLADLPFYSKQAVKVVTYQGCDARQKDGTITRINSGTGARQHAACLYDGCYDGICNSGKRDDRRRRAIDKMMAHCDHAFALNPDLLHFLPKDKASFLPYTIPNFDAIQPKSNNFFEQDKITIVHAPTQRVTKGSAYVIKAVEALQEKFPNKISFKLVENMPYEEALEVYRTADLVIDQLLIGWYGGLAVEVMKMGIPVAAYINPDDLKFLPPGFAEALPILNMTKDNILEKLEHIITHRDMLVDQGAQAKAFVEQWHDPKYVATLTKKVYEACAA
jgi:hypothetical protein